MLPTDWKNTSKADQVAWSKPMTYVKWIIDKAIEAGYISSGGVVIWGDITGNIIDQTDLITYIQAQQDDFIALAVAL